MNIIIDPVDLDSYQDNDIVLELDTIRLLPEDRTVTAYCVVETVPLQELVHLEGKKKMHSELLEKYRHREWDQCQQLLEDLMGAWRQEVDSFYQDLGARIAKYKEQDPGETWNGIIEKHTGSR